MPSPQGTPVSELLRADIDSAGKTVRGLAKELANGQENAEAKRRLLNKWLAGTLPDRQNAIRLAEALDQPSDRYITDRRAARQSQAEELRELRDRLERLERRVGIPPSPEES